MKQTEAPHTELHNTKDTESCSSLNTAQATDSESTVSKQVTICNRLGLHARAAAKVAALASQFIAQQQFVHDKQYADCKSIMSLLMLAAGQGTELTLRAQGPDAKAATQAMEALIANRFDEAE